VPTSLRARLSLWNAAGFAVLLGGSGAGVYAFVAAAVGSRTDAYLAQTATALAEALDGGGAPPAAAVDRFRLRDIGVAVFDATAPGAPRVLAATRGTIPDGAPDGAPYPFGGPWGAAAAAGVAARAVREGTVAGTLGEGPSAERVTATARPVAGPGGARVLVAAASQSLGAQEAVLREAREALVAGVLLLLGVAGAGGYAVAWRSLAPIEAMSRRAALIEAGTLHERLPAGGQATELARLAGAFNGLLARVEAAVGQQRQFMADASHELRTPVAIVRGEAELALAQPARPEAEYRAALQTTRAQAEALTRLVDDLFLLARPGPASRAPRARRSTSRSWPRGACARCARWPGRAASRSPSSPTRSCPWPATRGCSGAPCSTCSTTPSSTRPRRRGARDGRARGRLRGRGGGDADRRLAPPAAVVPDPGAPLARLLDARWTGEFASLDGDELARAPAPPPAVRAPAPSAGPWARVTVADTGPGIPPEAQPHVFERFYRARRAAAGAGGPGDASGAGLGLAIVAWVAEAHGGRVALARSDAEGTVFALDLPLDVPLDVPAAEPAGRPVLDPAADSAVAAR
jgi:signal transduction histidine kinase